MGREDLTTYLRESQLSPKDSGSSGVGHEIHAGRPLMTVTRNGNEEGTPNCSVYDFSLGGAEW